MGAMRTTVCLPAAFVGGVLAGLVITRAARRSLAPDPFWSGAGAVASLTGSLACACVGLSGVAVLIAGILGGTVLFLAGTAVRAAAQRWISACPGHPPVYRMR
jgi:hypothetical protein